MSVLPKARLAALTRPFSFVGVYIIGVDYFGPLYIKVARHQEKRWRVLITCLTVKANHIKIAHDMTTDACIMATQNFIALRRTPLKIYSGNGVKVELNKTKEEVDHDLIIRKFSTSSTVCNT